MMDELLQKISMYNIDKLVFWTGAGIDYDRPTCLPLGNELTETLLTHACGIKYAKKIFEEWTNSRNIFNKVTSENICLAEIPRLETVLEGLRIFETDELQNKYSVIRGLESFKEAPPNYLHYLLAALLHLGANIVTTNYDICIQKAYQDLYSHDGYELYMIQTEGIYTFKSNFKGSGQLYYIHGIATDIERIGATLKTVKIPLQEQFVEQLKQWIDEDHCFIFLGYGGGDYLDVNPFFQSLSKDNAAMGIYVRHSSSDEMETVDLKRNEEILIGCFGQKYTVKANTAKFVERLSILLNVKILKTSLSYADDFLWINELKKMETSYPSEFNEASILAILFLLGINPNDIFDNGWAQRIMLLMNRNDTNQYLGYYGFQNCVRGNKEDDKNDFYSHINKSALAKSDKMIADKNYIWMFVEWLQFYRYRKDMTHALLNKQLISWHCITPLNHIGKMILAVYAYSNHTFFAAFKILYKKRLYDLLHLWKAFVKAGAKYTIEIDEINVAYINIGILELLIYNNQEESLKYILQARNCYIEESSIQGLVNSLLYLVIYYIVVGKSQNNFKMMEQAEHLFEETNTIIAHEKLTEQKAYLRNIVLRLLTTI